MPLGTEVGLGPDDIVLDVRWMNTPLRTEVDLGTGHIVLDVDPAVPESGTAPPPSFRPCLLWPRSPISATVELLL